MFFILSLDCFFSLQILNFLENHEKTRSECSWPWASRFEELIQKFYSFQWTQFVQIIVPLSSTYYSKMTITGHVRTKTGHMIATFLFRTVCYSRCCTVWTVRDGTSQLQFYCILRHDKKKIEPNQRILY